MCRKKLLKVLQCVAVYCSVLKVLQCVAVYCSVLQCLAVSPYKFWIECRQPASDHKTLQHTATHCNTLQHTATN